MKYPRTYHLPTSPGMTSDDKMATTLPSGEVIVTEKMDGENTTMTQDACHARSLNSSLAHPSRHMVAALWATIRYQIPDNWRVCGENLYARHSIAYDNLPGPFMVFNVWDGDTCLSWDETKAIAEMLGLPMVREIYRGVFDLKAITKIAEDVAANGGEGIVVRTVESFSYCDFSSKVAKWVRPNHVQTTSHWMHEKVIPNTFA